MHKMSVYADYYYYYAHTWHNGGTQLYARLGRSDTKRHAWQQYMADFRMVDLCTSTRGPRDGRAADACDDPSAPERHTRQRQSKERSRKHVASR